MSSFLGGLSFKDQMCFDATVKIDGDYFINHEIRIPSFTNQDSMERSTGFFRGSDGLSTL